MGNYANNMHVSATRNARDDEVFKLTKTQRPKEGIQLLRVVGKNHHNQKTLLTAMRSRVRLLLYFFMRTFFRNWTNWVTLDMVSK